METITTSNLLVRGDLIERQDEILTQGAYIMKAAKNVIHSSKMKAKSSTDKLIDLELVPPDHIEEVSKSCKELPFSITPHLLKIIKSEESNKIEL